jgi:hypothetical protein
MLLDQFPVIRPETLFTGSGDIRLREILTRAVSIKELLGVPEDAETTPKTAQQAMRRLIQQWPTSPADEMQRRWLIENATCPIIPGIPPMAQGLLLERLAYAITGIEELGDSARFPLFAATQWSTQSPGPQKWSRAGGPR